MFLVIANLRRSTIIPLLRRVHLLPGLSRLIRRLRSKRYMVRNPWVSELRPFWMGHLLLLKPNKLQTKRDHDLLVMLDFKVVGFSGRSPLCKRFDPSAKTRRAQKALSVPVDGHRRPRGGRRSPTSDGRPSPNTPMDNGGGNSPFFNDCSDESREPASSIRKPYSGLERVNSDDSNSVSLMKRARSMSKSKRRE